MNTTLLKALVALMLMLVLFTWSVISFSRSKTIFSFLQLFGAGCLIMVVLTHIFEALHVFPFMQWGSPNSIGHYLDLASAILGLTLFPFGFLLQRPRKQSA
jgi:Ca2+/Na+ antiporter